MGGYEGLGVNMGDNVVVKMGMTRWLMMMDDDGC